MEQAIAMAVPGDKALDMTTAGHPFVDEDRMQQRARQREALSTIPRTILEGLLPETISRTTLQSAAPCTEAALRDEADVHMQAAKGYLDAARRHAYSDAISAVIYKAATAEPSDIDAVQRKVAAEQRTNAVSDLRTQDAEAAMALRVLVPLLIWADEIAGDYIDGSVAELRPELGIDVNVDAGVRT